jgi:hypothetical protein
MPELDVSESRIGASANGSASTTVNTLTPQSPAHYVPRFRLNIALRTTVNILLHPGKSVLPARDCSFAQINIPGCRARNRSLVDSEGKIAIMTEMTSDHIRSTASQKTYHTSWRCWRRSLVTSKTEQS